MFGLMKESAHEKEKAHLLESIAALRNNLDARADVLRAYEQEIRSKNEALEEYKKQGIQMVGNWYKLCRAEVTIETEESGMCGNVYHYLRVSFRPQVKRPGTTFLWGKEYRDSDPAHVARERGMLSRLIYAIGVPGWNYNPENGTLKKTYEIESFCSAADDIDKATAHIQQHLEAALREQQYREAVAEDNTTVA